MKNILLLDDHPFILDTYVTMLKSTNTFKIEKFFGATSIEKALSIINEEPKIDIAFFDISMPKKGISNMEDGIDLALYFKSKHPFAKVVFITMHTEFHVLLKAIHLINPEVFISKNDVDTFTFSTLLTALKSDKTFYSTEMLEIYNWAKQCQIKLDVYDFQILSLTKKGVKTKELIEHLPLSLSAIEKRKSNIKLITSDFKGISY
ncbi:response regulator transcription factor [Flavobacterium facile]|uniref:response regulator transcription factor n=1 Tax=Flavobacterium facile TaxID=2893174 RepID=UPI002E79BDA0|nr:response regulator [Flavobacterium sp. T-12]